MAAGRDRPRSSLPTQPKVARFSDSHVAQRPPSPRRQTIATLPFQLSLRQDDHHHRNDSRVGKKRESGRRQSHMKLTNSEKIGELLDEYKQNIKKDTDHQLDEHQKTLNSSVEQLTVYFESKLKLLQDAEALLLISIIDENLRIPSESKSPSKTREPQFKIVRLSDRIAEFEQFVQEKEKLLQNLTKDWNDTQASIICLAVEILGTEPFEISEDDIDEELNDKIYKASRKHDADRGQHQDILTKTQDIEDKVKQLSVDTKKTVKAQQRNLKINQKKQFNKLFAGFEAMVD